LNFNYLEKTELAQELKKKKKREKSNRLTAGSGRGREKGGDQNYHLSPGIKSGRGKKPSR